MQIGEVKNRSTGGELRRIGGKKGSMREEGERIRKGGEGED